MPPDEVAFFFLEIDMTTRQETALIRARDVLRGLDFKTDKITVALSSIAQALDGSLPDDSVDAQLLKFYGVTTAVDLIAAQARHIEKLQSKLPQSPSFAPQRVREA